ncbi:MAG: RNA polymerase factor sigma-54 [Pseudomonadota bacterium]|nr:RNA polymerase factor sigma-54 [Pseudomonadota bacterium]
MLKPSLQPKLSQQLKMTPQMQQALRLLQLPILALETHILEALDENVMLEKVEDLDEIDVIEPDWTDTQTTKASDKPPDPKSYSPGDDQWILPLQETLTDYLLWQLDLSDLSSRTNTIGQAVIGGINENGYLEDDAETIQSTLAPDLASSIDEIEKVIKLVQKFDPAGVGARSPSECISLQLDQLDPSTLGLSLARDIAGNHLELYANHKHQPKTLRRLLQVSEEDFGNALLLVKNCSPHPGDSINAPTAEYVVPDVYVQEKNGSWIVRVNNSDVSQLRINQIYAKALGRKGEYDERLSTQLIEAKWLIRSLKEREETLRKVATTIVNRQKEFLWYGEEYMRPMVFRDIAETIGVVESTVSRVIKDKYMNTPRGTIPFRSFFSSHLSSDDGEKSSTAVKAKIRKLISAENPMKPLSDEKITNSLSANGIKISRRAVAKYRKEMKIASSSQRKRSKMV